MSDSMTNTGRCFVTPQWYHHSHFILFYLYFHLHTHTSLWIYIILCYIMSQQRYRMITLAHFYIWTAVELFYASPVLHRHQPRAIIIILIIGFPYQINIRLRTKVCHLYNSFFSFLFLFSLIIVLSQLYFISTLKVILFVKNSHICQLIGKTCFPHLLFLHFLMIPRIVCLSW